MRNLPYLFIAAIFVTGFHTAQASEVSTSSCECETVVCECGYEVVSENRDWGGMFDRFRPKDTQWFVQGHVESGIYRNQHKNRDQHFGNSTDPGNSVWLQNVRFTEAQMNQAVVAFGRKADGKDRIDFGFRVDLMHGTDAVYAQSLGLEFGTGHGLQDGSNHTGGRWGSGDYYTALSQMYVEAEYKGFNLKFGKFLGTMGHEGLYSTDRFFYSLSDTFGILPVTQSGALLTYTFNDKLSVHAGWAQNDDRFFDSSHSNRYIAGFRYDFATWGYLKYSASYGRNTGVLVQPAKYLNIFISSLIVGLKFGKRVDYTFEWTYRREKHESVFQESPDIYYDSSYGINQELTVKVNRWLSLGVRGEWTRYISKNIWTWAGGIPGRYEDTLDKVTYTLAANITPASWITIRPEIRHDHFLDKSTYPNRFVREDGRGTNKQFSYGISAIVKF